MTIHHRNLITNQIHIGPIRNSDFETEIINEFFEQLPTNQVSESRITAINRMCELIRDEEVIKRLNSIKLKYFEKDIEVLYDVGLKKSYTPLFKNTKFLPLL